MENLKKARSKKGLTQEALGRKVNVQKSAISKYERGDIQPSRDILVKLAEVLNVTTDYLLGITDKPDRVSPPELKEYGVEWVSVVKKARASGLSPEDIEKIIDVVSKHK